MDPFTGRPFERVSLWSNKRRLLLRSRSPPLRRYTAVDDRPAGVIAVADALRPTARQTVQELRKRGIPVAMLTGDNRATADRAICRGC